MPDQVRHDKQKLKAFLNYDTVSCTGMTAKTPRSLDLLIYFFKFFVLFVVIFLFRKSVPAPLVKELKPNHE